MMMMTMAFAVDEMKRKMRKMRKTKKKKRKKKFDDSSCLHIHISYSAQKQHIDVGIGNQWVLRLFICMILVVFAEMIFRHQNRRFAHRSLTPRFNSTSTCAYFYCIINITRAP